MSVSGGDVTKATLSSLGPNTNYSVSVAAINSKGTGNFSTYISVLTG